MDLSKLVDPVSAALASTGASSRPEAGRRRVIGVSDAAKTAVLAGLLRDTTSPALIVVPRSGRVADLYEELAFWLGPEAGRRLRLFPQRDILPYERALDDPWDVRARLETIAALHAGGGARRAEGSEERGAPIVIASVEAVAQRTLSPEAARAALTTLRIGDRIEPEDLLRRLQSTGYEVVSLVEMPGQAARRGGILDVYPPQAEAPLRIEFFGPEVDSIRSFDVDTQRSRDKVAAVDLGIATDFSPDAALAGEMLDSLDFGACNEETELTLREELAAIANGSGIPGPAFLPGLLSPHSLVDHLPSDALVILDELTDLSRALDEYVAETATMRIEREARGELPIGLPPAQANWTDLQPRLEAVDVIELARFATEEGGAFRPPFAPAPGFGGRVRILARDLRDSMRQGEAVVIVSQQAHRLLTLLDEEALPVRALDEAIEELTPGVVQVIKGSIPHGWLLKGDGMPPPPDRLPAAGEGGSKRAIGSGRGSAANR